MTKKSTKLVIISVLAIAVAGFGYNYWFNSEAYESTDNAQLDTDILPVRAEITGKVSRIYFADNQPVKQGDTLISFDTKELKAKVQQAEASLENAKANVTVNDTKALVSNENANASAQNSQGYNQDIVASKANLDKAQKDFNRINELMIYKATTQDQLETTQTKLAVAKANYEKALNQQKGAFNTTSGLKTQSKVEQNQIVATKALVKQKLAEFLQMQQQLDHAYIIAPFDGIVTKRTVQEEQYVSVGTSLCTIINQSKLWVTANFKETQLQFIKIGQEVSVKLDAYPDLELKGKVESFGGATGAKFSLIPPDNATGNFIKITQRFPIRIALFSLDKNKPSVLFAGLSAFVKVKTN
ncbi:HlyD family secretion protein [Flavobacterium psychrophilum]|uniref:HlyD family secretion protein n=1 Tax=Flavobacterium psychrophilum TaxID=96345 RepID=UPI000B7C4C10|nr:HlyD family secretion protein [Flavobacterium psychrophilum]EKT4500632.1 HlyD family secretion protein [Flavobacterium psychrophilum]MBF2023695.1 HlyD family secretion protein [Flavobacterium psychrophilum]MCB5984302.1 HlyD family secretion protein [Flavobacterium psychrophilum]MCB5994323.1 HlyD family secretion protein [Flavobacterium psychrophilum]MCB5996470.1 HlyD family secretion protein [Flavobacterium psychrophilum]